MCPHNQRIMNKLIIAIFSLLLLSACQPPKNKISDENWQTVLQEKLPLLGHRNWIVITDMAYPLQAKEGITTLYADESYPQVLVTVKKILDDSPHVYTHVYQDQELSFLKNDICPGIDELKKEMETIVPTSEITQVAHDQLIARLDSISRLFEVVIIKTGLTKPYTSTFFELDCKYWDSHKQSILNQRIADTK